MDDNFDGRISYKELRDHVRSMGFVVDNEGLLILQKSQNGRSVEPFQWRDKGIEVVIRTLNNLLDKKPPEEYFKKFDSDYDNHLTPSEFRQSLLSIKNS
jgi:Ca2+-binding EF-hand superfamily protein